MPLWLAADPLILASKSAARRTLLVGAGITIEVRPADIDERAAEKDAPGPEAVAALLARVKANAIAKQWPGRLVLGA